MDTTIPNNSKKITMSVIKVPSIDARKNLRNCFIGFLVFIGMQLYEMFAENGVE
jgi:hypothetical protein